MADYVIKNKKGVKNTLPQISVRNSHNKNVLTSLDSLVFGRAKDFERSLTKKRIVLATSSILVLVILGSYFAPKGKAESALFYPTSCLGGWTNPNKAEGVPETTGEAGDYSYNNSASLAPDTSADLYCGSFKGEIPKSSVPTKMVLTIFWKTLNKVESLPVTGSSFASSTLEILDATSSPSFVSMASTTSGNEVQPASVVGASSTLKILDATSSASLDVAPTIPMTSANPVPQKQEFLQAPSSTTSMPSPSDPQSYLYQIGKDILSVLSTPVYALEGITIATNTSEVSTSTDIITSQTTATDTPKVSTSTAVITPLTIATGTLQVSTSTDVSKVPVDPYSNALVEVFYTLDGSTWNSLGKVNKDGMNFNSFVVPVTATSTWDDISNIQFKVQSVVSIDAKPEILIDGMVLGVEYKGETKKEEVQNGDLKGFHLTVGSSTGNIIASVTVDPIQGEIFNIGSSLGGTFIIYKKGSQNLLSTGGMGNIEPISMNSNTFDVGVYTVLVTSRVDGCAGMDFSSCLTDKDLIGYTTLQVTPTQDTPLEYVHTQ